MIFAPAPMSASAASCAVSAGTAMTPTMMLRSRAISRDVVDRADREVADARPDLLRVVVEHRRDRDAVLGEDRRARDRAPEPAGADERDVVLALRAQDLPDLLEQRVGAVADAALAEPSERREVAPDLRRVDVRVLGDLLRRDPLLAHLPRLRQDLEVPAQARCDSHGEAFGHVLSPCRRFVTKRHDSASGPPDAVGRTVYDPARRARSASASTKYVNACSPSISTTGRSSRYRASSSGVAADVDELELEVELGLRPPRRPRAPARRGCSRPRGRR